MVLQDNTKVELVVGQVWTIQDAPSLSTRLVIQRIEPFSDKGLIAVHVSIYGLPQSGRFKGIVSHMPFEREALAGSLNEAVDELPLSDVTIDEGYADWKNAKGGIFTIRVAKAIEMVLDVSGVRTRGD